jgi:endogenous inhibitor of DNA gyrase (YacG/DUF329 family)
MMAPRKVNCPHCGELCEWSIANPWRPFCSERCKMMDLGAWASESYRIPVVEHDDIGGDGLPAGDDAPN